VLWVQEVGGSNPPSPTRLVPSTPRWRNRSNPRRAASAAGSRSVAAGAFGSYRRERLGPWPPTADRHRSPGVASARPVSPRPEVAP
jgi:hypothetical protein